ncbi:MAG: hypothetical protein M3O34_09335 [Chloroflexota bacterium]|nr:hypothetical protein [Chloroflexota bacterium]
MTTRDLAENIERVEAYAYEDMLRAMPPEAADGYGARVERIGVAVAQVATEIDVPFFNRVVGLGLREPITQPTLDAIDRVYRGRNIRYMLALSPAVLSLPLHDDLISRGLRRMDN